MADITSDILRIVQRIETRLSAVLSIIVTMEDRMSAELEDLKREVAESQGVTERAITMIVGLAEQIRDLKDSPAELEALADELDQQQNALAEALKTGSGA